MLHTNSPLKPSGKKGVHMNENLKDFFRELAQNEGLRSRMSKAESADEAYAIACEAVSGFGKDEFVEAMAELSRADENLSLDDLENAAGGYEIAMSAGGSPSIDPKIHEYLFGYQSWYESTNFRNWYTPR